MTSIINAEEKKKITAMFAKKWDTTMGVQARMETLDNLTLTEIMYALRHYELEHLTKEDYGLAYRFLRMALDSLENLERCAEL